MHLSHKTIVITGAGAGIGAALARRFHSESPRGIVVADIDGEAATTVADEIGGLPFQLDVADESQV